MFACSFLKMFFKRKLVQEKLLGKIHITLKITLRSSLFCWIFGCGMCMEMVYQLSTLACSVFIFIHVHLYIFVMSLAGLELISFISALGVLCFRFVTKTMLMQH